MFTRKSWAGRVSTGLAIACLAGGLVYANSAPPPAEVTQMVASALSIRKFSGASVDSVLLSEPEKKGAGYVYRGEFNVARTGKKITCEDWTFALERRHGSWIVGEIVRGRCND